MHRIASLGQHNPGVLGSPGGTPAQVPGTVSATAAAAAAQPVTAPVTGSAASPPAVMQMPLAQVIIQPTSSQYVTVGAQELVPIWTTDGAAVPGTAPGRWDQLRAAGRP
jgi:hypothetical protein